MPTRYVQADRAAQELRAVRSNEASRLLADLMAVTHDIRRLLMAGLDDNDLRYLMRAAARECGTAFALWEGDPVGFCEEVLGENLWSKQREYLTSLVNYRRTAVPAGFGVGKTAGAGLAVAYMGCVHPVGTALSITIATRMRQVQRQLWPHVRRVHARAGLPGVCDMVQWRAPDHNGVLTDLAYGFSSPDESGMQGIHVPGRLLLVVDEAGGIGRLVGQSTRNFLTGHASMLAIGNPPTDDEGSWFEGLCERGFDPDDRETNTIRIAATDSPAVTGEARGTPLAVCRTCPPGVAEHDFAEHLVDQDWIDDAVREHGEDAPYVTAKVHAKFPRGGSFRIIPTSWVDAAAEAPEPDPADPRAGALLALDSLDLPYHEPAPWLVSPGAWVRLGVDVAADGGDELVIARAISSDKVGGILVTIEHISAGEDNAHSINVAGKVQEHILRAQALAAALGTQWPVRVKIDGIGVGWGVAGTLQAWGAEGLHKASIVPVIVSESTGREPDSETLRPGNKRDEMWLTGRRLLQPVGKTGVGIVRLRVDEKCLAQLRSPKYTTTGSGLTKVEPKAAMRKRGLSSPDRAEAALLAVYEPLVPETPKIELLV